MALFGSLVSRPYSRQVKTLSGLFSVPRVTGNALTSSSRPRPNSGGPTRHKYMNSASQARPAMGVRIVQQKINHLYAA